MAADLDLLIDVANKRLIRSFGSVASAQLPDVIKSDTITVYLKFIEATNNNAAPWKYIDKSTATVKFAIGQLRTAALPTAGTFTLNDGTDTTSAISYGASAAALQTALNALNASAGPFSGGAVTVTGSSGGPWVITYPGTTNRALLTAPGNNLYPTSSIVVSEVRAGDGSTLSEIQRVELWKNPPVYQDTWSALPLATGTVTVIQNGSATQSEIQTLDWSNPQAYGGGVVVGDGTVSSGTIPYNATASDVESFLNAMNSNTGPFGGTVSVAGANGFFTVTWDSVSNRNTLSLNVSGLQVPIGLQADVSLNTAGVVDLLNGAASVESNLEVEITESGKRKTVCQADITIGEEVINGSATVPTPISDYYTTTESNNAYVQNRSAITGLTGGGASKLDGITTTTATVGWLVAVQNTGGTLFYQLVSSTAAETMPTTPFVIRPDDYAGTTNEKVWVYRGGFDPTGSPLVWNPDQSKFHPFLVSGAAGSETLSIENGVTLS